MMVLSAVHSDAGLGEFLAARARSSSWRRLAFDVLVGATLAGVSVWRMNSVSIIVGAGGICFFAYGGWGLVDRLRSRRAGDQSEFGSAALEALSAFLAAMGIVAACAILYAIWAAALGTWIS